MEQKRFLLAIMLSGLILFGWQYFFASKQPVENANNAQNTQTASNSPISEQNQSVQPTPTVAQPQIEPNAVADSVPQRTLTVSTPLYDVKIDTRGAVAISWIIKKKNDASNRPLSSIAGTKGNHPPLELISPKGLEQQPREAPLKLLTADQNLNQTLDARNYQIANLENDSGSGDARVDVQGNETKSVDLILRDQNSGIELTKRLIFRPDSYTVELKVDFKINGQPASDVKLAIGPSIGDQGVPHYTFYSVAPEGVAAINDGSVPARHLAASIYDKEGGARKERIDGAVEWASVSDTYFTMTAVLPQPMAGLEYHTPFKYENEINGVKEARHLITAYVPVPTDGKSVLLYTGPKDHYLLENANKEISERIGRPVNLEGLIDYGWFRRISYPLSLPILWAIKELHDITGNYGVAIIIFTFIIYSLFFPLKWRSAKAMKKTAKLQPQMKEIQEKMKGLKSDDPRLKELQMEQLRLMKEGNFLGGCLPIMIQMPFFFALFRAITVSIDFRQAEFLYLKDLSAADPFHALPILMGASMLGLQLSTPMPTQEPAQRWMMAIMLPAMMLYMMWSAPAGLLLYWFCGNLIMFGQQTLINRLIKSKDEQEPPPANAQLSRSSKIKTSVSNA